MEAFSNHLNSFLIDSIFHSDIPGFSQEPNTITTAPCFPQIYPPESHYNEASVTNKNGTDSSSVVDDKAESGEQVNQKVIFMAKKRSNSDGSSMSSVQFMEGREVKGKKQKKCDGVRKVEKVKKNDHEVGKKDQKIKVAEEKPTDYVHVRARRGQATDSHSLAERVRREKISERMKMLQALVPGCDKMTGKALILDEIINYVQSLKNQVEFLSMKLGSVNSMFSDFGMDLDGLLVTPERLNSMESPLPNGQQSSQDQPIGFPPSTANTFTTPNTYPLLDNISSLLFDQQLQFPNILQPQDNGQLLWDVDEQRQKHINQSGFSNNNLCSFH